MNDGTSFDPRPAPPPSAGATVIQLATRRRGDDVLSSISFVFGGVHYGTLDVAAAYTKGKPIVLYVVPQREGDETDGFAGPIDCLITDDVALAASLAVAR